MGCSLVSTTACRTLEQEARMRAAQQSRKCPFCFFDTEDEFLNEGLYWYVKENKPPYNNTKYHLLLILKRHICRPEELNEEEKLEWFTLNEWIAYHYKIEGGGLVMRFGSLDHSGGSIAHLHSHVIVPRINGGFTLAVFHANKKLLTFLRKHSPITRTG